METEEEKTTCIEPVAYLWDGSERQEALFKQVADFCGYDVPEAVVEARTNEETGETEEVITNADEITAFKAEWWPKIWQAIRYISNITCWGDADNETFLTSCREQVYHAETVCKCRPTCCNCDEDVIVVPLEYAPFPEKPFVSGLISVVVDGKPQTTEISADYLNEHLDPITGKLYITRDEFPDVLLDGGRCCCLCKRKLAIKIVYNAGYDTIPDGLLPLICPIVAKIDEAKIGLSNCHQAMTQVVGLLKRKKVGNVEYEWSNTDTNSAKTEALYTDIYNLANLDEVMALSRCYLMEEVSEIGDVV